MDKKDKRAIMFYGRARRIELVKKICIYVLLLIAVVVLVFVIIKGNQKHYVNKNFNLLRTYFTNKGYVCEMIEKSGGECHSQLADTDTNTTASVQYKFTRYDEGFNYFVKAGTYTIEIRHIVNTYNDIILETNNKALGSDIDKKFYCTTDDGVVGNLQSCKTKDGETVKNDVYIGAVEMAINDLNNIINNSGYKRDKLLKDYIWEQQKK